MAEHLIIGDDIATWPIVFESFEVLEISQGSYGVFRFEVDQTFEHVALINRAPERSAAWVGASVPVLSRSMPSPPLWLRYV